MNYLFFPKLERCNRSSLWMDNNSIPQFIMEVITYPAGMKRSGMKRQRPPEVYIVREPWLWQTARNRRQLVVALVVFFNRHVVDQITVGSRPHLVWRQWWYYDTDGVGICILGCNTEKWDKSSLALMSFERHRVNYCLGTRTDTLKPKQK